MLLLCVLTPSIKATGPISLKSVQILFFRLECMQNVQTLYNNLTTILAKKSQFFSSFIDLSDCMPQFRCWKWWQLSWYYNGHFDMKAMEIGSGLRLGNVRKKWIFLTSFLSNASQPEPVDRFKQTSCQKLLVFEHIEDGIRKCCSWVVPNSNNKILPKLFI